MINELIYMREWRVAANVLLVHSHYAAFPYPPKPLNTKKAPHNSSSLFPKCSKSALMCVSQPNERPSSQCVSSAPTTTTTKNLLKKRLGLFSGLSLIYFWGHTLMQKEPFRGMQMRRWLIQRTQSKCTRRTYYKTGHADFHSHNHWAWKHFANMFCKREHCFRCLYFYFRVYYFIESFWNNIF